MNSDSIKKGVERAAQFTAKGIWGLQQKKYKNQ
jgi:hypothetical protein